MEYNKECNNSQNLQQNNNDDCNNGKPNILMDLIPELQFYIMSKLVEIQAYDKQYDVNNHIIIKGMLCNLFSTCKYFKQFDNEKNINYIIVNICKSLKDKGYSNYQASTNELKEILDKGYLKPDFLEIKKLILSGADANVKNKYGDTVIMWAAMGGCKEIAKLLIKAGADVNAKDSMGRTALMWAARKGYENIVKLLIAASADIDIRDKYGATALIAAVHSRVKDIIVELLIAAGANVNIQDEYGYTALMQACKFSNRIEIIQLLIKSGADVNTQGKIGHTALMLARKNRYTNIVALLIASGAIE